TLGNGLEPETLAKLDDRLAQARIDAVDVAIGDVAAIDLELAEGQLAQPGKRGIARAEIVERQSAVERPQGIGNIVCDIEIMNDLVFRHLHDEAGPIGCARSLLAQ